jgi:hypothetical protein
MAKAPKQAHSPPSEPIRGSNAGYAAMERLISALSGTVDVLIEELREFNNPDKASALAILGTKIGQITGEMRKLEAAERDASAKLSPQAVAGYLRALDKAEWTAVRRDIDGHFGGGSVLA